MITSLRILIAQLENLERTIGDCPVRIDSDTINMSHHQIKDIRLIDHNNEKKVELLI